MSKSVSRSGRSLAVALAAAVALSGVTGCEGNRGNERWVVTENTQVEIDWDAVNTAYREAEGPEDFERRVNEIYTGDEVISISVRDEDERTQVVTGFFDKNSNGRVEDPEKIFTIRRDVVGEGAAQYQIVGAGPYAHYHSPIWDIAAGMMLGSFLSNMFMPGYRPIYVTPYTTTPARRGALMSHRDSYRAANPSKFPPKSSTSGRKYGARGSQWGSGGSGTRSSGGRRGGGFGTRAGRTRTVVRA